MTDARALQAEIDRLRASLLLVKKQADVLDERVSYYRSEWESACEREQYALKDRDDLHRMHCLDLDALLALTDRAEAAEAKLDRYRGFLVQVGINGGYEGELRITGTLTKRTDTYSISACACTCPSCQMKEYRP